MNVVNHTGQGDTAAMLESPYETLPFVQLQKDGATVFWAPDRTGDYEAMCARGREYAEVFIVWLREHQNPVLFGSIVRQMTADGLYEGVEIGFCNRLGFELVGLVAV